MNKMGWLQTFMRYAFIGAGNTTVCIALMALGDYFGLSYLVFTAIAYLITLFMSFFLNLIFTFRVQGAVGYRLMLFLVLNGSNILCVEAIEYGLIEGLDVHRWVAIITGMTWYVITGFLMNRCIVYKAA